MKKSSSTDHPESLKSEIESLSGTNMDHVVVHYNSPKPSQLNAHAYAEGTDIKIAPGQERNLPHEVWHVIQQKQGRVSPTVRTHIELSTEEEAQRTERELLAKRTPI